mmetsp:Transcript_14787/g.36175  ORF Transcript_14787/g.36175 Transcript_14787/m.36175 type:complete len:87 (+) Transcript_14787:1694-1954(+)
MSDNIENLNDSMSLEGADAAAAASLGLTAPAAPTDPPPLAPVQAPASEAAPVPGPEVEPGLADATSTRRDCTTPSCYKVREHGTRK